MRTSFLSLRGRLFHLILWPLVLIAVFLAFLRYVDAKKTASDLFDRSLLSAALAISRDVAHSGGDVLSRSTQGLINDSAGGQVFYHVAGPGGIYVTGYAYPPIAEAPKQQDTYSPAYFEATYRGEQVRVLQVSEIGTFETLVGETTVSVWQRLADREALALQLALRAVVLVGLLLLTLAGVVWFGVRSGLWPLLDLQDAIAMRSPRDLKQIQRPVPHEVVGIVRTLNTLFGQLEDSIAAHKAFISDAAHQLRNPANAVQSMAEAMVDAPKDTDLRARAQDLLQAARQSSRIAEQLLSLDRLRHGLDASDVESFDLVAATREVCTDAAARILRNGLDFEFEARNETLLVVADQISVCEAIKNLIDNAEKHGGSALSRICVEIGADDQGMAVVTVTDDGKGLSPDDQERAFSRFGQIGPSQGSGLGLAIVSSVAEQNGGSLRINACDQGASLSLSLTLERGT
ncbi:MAG: sensor histidine kinase [Rhodospirillaceae bacterium]